jgi:nicotinate-nucleotide adenylyltransferase
LRSIGLYCGTFNPVHNGHLLIAECAHDQFGLDKVLFVTSPNPPHRHTGLLAAKLRHELVEAAVADNPHFEASTLEIDRSGPSYTIDTVKAVQRGNGEKRQINLIIGGDNLRSIGSWHKSDELIANCRFLVAPRLVYRDTLVTQKQKAFLETVVDHENTAQQYDLPGADIAIIDFPAVSISSSMIRERLKQGKSVLYMVPKPVHDILLTKRYYIDDETT